MNAPTVTLAEHAGKTKHPSLRGAGVSIQLQAVSQAAKKHLGCERALSGPRARLSKHIRALRKQSIAFVAHT